MHQPVDGDPLGNRPNRHRRGPTPLHHVAIDANVNLRDLWISGRPDDYQRQQVSTTFTWTRAYQRRTSAVKMPGCFTN